MLSTAAATLATATAASTTPAPRLVKAAHEFEAQMMKELLKPMTDQSLLGDENDADSGSGTALKEFASEALGEALSEQGGFGVASHIIQQLSRSSNQGVTSPVTTNRHQKNVMRTSK